MCEYGKIIDQAKSIAGQDYAATVDSGTRAVLVIAVESPESLQTIQDIYAAGECAAKVAAEA